ncbi:hypothetical protein [Kocuria sp. CPCC 205263]|uniref:hypothetical protein n=1 Tax=Kocuria sp. CPCC 205263 TaxID=3073555 RepID=UPI0034D5649B
MCGASPIPASSGKTNRYRLNRGGDRQANGLRTRSPWCACPTTNTRGAVRGDCVPTGSR